MRLFPGELKHEIGGEAVEAECDMLIEPVCLNVVQFRQVTIEDHFLSSEPEYTSLDPLIGNVGYGAFSLFCHAPDSLL